MGKWGEVGRGGEGGRRDYSVAECKLYSSG